MKITDIQRFCMHDGPGLRTTVFLKGCPLRCEWCHNPETQDSHPQLLHYPEKCISCGACTICPTGVHRFDNGHTLYREACLGCGVCVESCPTLALDIAGREISPDEILTLVLRDAPFYGGRGGITLSGGEPFLQREEAIELLRLCKESGISTAVETCGFFPTDILEKAVPLCDLFLWDVKDTEGDRHRRYTGQDNDLILKNLMTADFLGAHTRLRCILVGGVNTNEAHYDAVGVLYHKLSYCEGVELLPCHTLGDAKRLAMGQQHRGMNHFVPTCDQIDAAKNYLSAIGVPLIE